MTALPNLDLLVLDDLTSDRQEHPPDVQDLSHGTVHSTDGIADPGGETSSTIFSRGGIDPPDDQDQSHDPGGETKSF